MGRIIEFVRNNIFWLMVVIAASALAGVYVFVARGLAADVRSLRQKSTASVRTLRRRSRETEIPNRAMIAAAAAEETQLQALYGQLLVLYAARSGAFHRDFDALEGVEDFGVKEGFDWWAEYEGRWRTLLRETRERFDAPEDVLLFRRTPPDRSATLKQVKKLQGEFWRLKYTVDALAAASPESKPLLRQLVTVRLGNTGPGHLRHPWLRATPVRIVMKMAYEKIGRLIAALQNSPQPLLVQSYSSVQPGLLGGRRGGPPAEFTPVVDVIVHAEIVEFLPLVRSVAFSGPLFKDGAAVTRWLRKEERALNVATRVLLEGIPGLKRCAEARLGGPLEEFGRGARQARDRELKSVEEEAATALAETLEAARGEDGKVPPERGKAARKLHDETVARRKEKVQEKFEDDLLAIYARAGGFALVYDYLRPLIPQEAYLVGPNASDGDYVIVRGPDVAPYGAGKWWVAKGKDGAIYKDRKDGVRALSQGAVRRTAIAVGKKSASTVTLFANPKTKAVEQMLVAGGRGWRAYAVLTVKGRPVVLDDVAFRFAPVIRAAAAKLGTPAFDVKARRVEVTLREALAAGSEKSFEVSVKESPGSKLKITAGLRK